MSLYYMDFAKAKLAEIEGDDFDNVRPHDILKFPDYAAGEVTGRSMIDLDAELVKFAYTQGVPMDFICDFFKTSPSAVRRWLKKQYGWQGYKQIVAEAKLARQRRKNITKNKSTKGQ